MISTTRRTKAQSLTAQSLMAQRPFGVSAYGPALLEGPAISAVAGVQVSTCARVRHIGGMALATTTGDFPGTSAWRPPIC
jgi:hypothetical protein